MDKTYQSSHLQWSHTGLIIIQKGGDNRTYPLAKACKRTDNIWDVRWYGHGGGLFLLQVNVERDQHRE